MNEPATIFVKKNVTDNNKLSMLSTLLLESGFWDHLSRTCQKKGQSNSTCKVVIKPNISIASQKMLKSYTDPALVDHLVSLLASPEHGYKNVSIVESENMYAHGFPEHTPNLVGHNLGYKTPIINLTAEQSTEQCFDTISPKTHICLAKRMLDADYIINFPKGRNHCIYKMTGALKNMFGTIPDRNKIFQFHNKESGMDVIEATQFVYHKTPPNFTIMDWIESVDGEDEHFSDEALSDHKDVGRLIAGQNAIATDMYLQQKMGYQPFESEITRPFQSDIKLEVIGDTLEPLIKWRKVPLSTRIGFKSLLKLMSILRKNAFIDTKIKKTMHKKILMNVLENAGVTE